MYDHTPAVPRCVDDLLLQRCSERVALAAPGRPALSYAALADLAASCRAHLAAEAIGPGDRVAIILPNGPEMAAAFIAVAASATTCPLNPAYREEEFAFYLDDLGAKALILPAGHCVDPAYLRHHLASKNRSLDTGQLADLGRAYRSHPAARRRGSLPQRYAALSYPRSDRGGALVALQRRFDFLLARLQRLAVHGLAAGSGAELVYGGAYHASGHPKPRPAPAGGGEAG